jgi:bacteriophage N4 adsorption protein B
VLVGEFSFQLLSNRDLWMLSTVLLSSLFLLDDLIVDFLALFKKQKARKLSDIEIKKMLALPEKKIGVLVANWHEEEIIERIVTGNVKALQYSNYEIILGVYPNDIETLEAARRIEKKLSNVTVVVNTLNGPTSKGQMLNLMVNYIDSHNQANPDNAFDMILIQDSEDIIHPFSLKLMNKHADQYDFIQIPVFSLDVPLTKFTAGVYIDEFIESHTKDLLVRDYFSAGIPSAGVGTGMRWSAVAELIKLQQGAFLNENTLTEDYHLGLTCHDLKFKSHFACEYFDYKDPKTNETKIEYIATREYFPQRFRQSIRQKTRWSLGISLQGFEERKWKSSHAFERYFLWRDRKGLVNAPLFTMALFFTIFFCYSYFVHGFWPRLESETWQDIFITLMWANLVFSLLRIVNRIRLVAKVYGGKMASLVPIRWVVSNFINTSCTYNAVYQWSSSKLRGELPKWSKTDHIIPANFGLENKEILDSEISPAPVTNTDKAEQNIQV